MRNQGEVLLQLVGNPSETMLGAGEQQWGEGWVCSARRDCSICTEGAIPGAALCYFLLRTLLVFSYKRCARSRPVVTKCLLGLLNALFRFGREGVWAPAWGHSCQRVASLHLFDQQLFDARAESSQCPQARQKGGSQLLSKSREGQHSSHKPCQLSEQRQVQVSLLESQHPLGFPCAGSAPQHHHGSSDLCG